MRSLKSIFFLHFSFYCKPPCRIINEKLDDDPTIEQYFKTSDVDDFLLNIYFVCIYKNHNNLLTDLSTQPHSLRFKILNIHNPITILWILFDIFSFKQIAYISNRALSISLFITSSIFNIANDGNGNNKIRSLLVKISANRQRKIPKKILIYDYPSEPGASSPKILCFGVTGIPKAVIYASKDHR